MVMGLPDSVKFQIAPAYGKVRFSTIPSTAWVDITQYVKKYEKTSGTSHELQLVDAATITLTCANYDGKLTPNGGGWSNSASVVPNGALDMPIRVVFNVAGTDYPRFSGYVEEWGPRRWSSREFQEFTIVAHDGLKAATDAYMPASFLGQQYLKKSPAFWYPCDDNSMTLIGNKSVQNFAAYDASGNEADGSFGYVRSQFATSTMNPNPRPTLNLQADTLTCNRVSQSVIAGSTWWLNFVALLDNSSSILVAKPMMLASVTNGKSGWAITAVYSRGSWYPKFTAYNSAGTLVQSITSSVPFTVQVNQMVSLKLSGGTYTLYLNGAPVGTCGTSGIAVPANSLVLMGATGPGSGVTYGPWFGGVGNIGMGSASVSNSDISNWWGYVYPIGRYTGEWVGLEFDNIGPPALDRVVDTGQTSLIIPDSNGSRAQTVRAAMEQTVLDELGQVWVSPSGVFTFRDRSYLTKSPNNNAVAYFGTNTGYIPIVEADISNTGQDLWTAAEGSRGGSNPVIVDSTTAISIPGRTGGYGTRTFHYPSTLDYFTDAEVRTVLKSMIARYKSEKTRVNSITVRPWTNSVAMNTNQMATLMTLDVWKNIWVTLKDGFGTSGTLNTAALIEGIDETIDFGTGDYTMTIHTVPPWNAVHFFSIGTDVIGGTSPIAY